MRFKTVDYLHIWGQSHFVSRLANSGQRAFILFSALSLLLYSIASTPVRANTGAHKASFTVLNYMTGWSLDTLGYHPSIYLLIENTGGHDLSNVPIKFQARFTDMQTLEVAVARSELRSTLKPFQQFRLCIQSPHGYELPIDTNRWPAMECKLMTRVGNVSDDGTETLLIAKIEQSTQTKEEAFQRLNEVSSFHRPAHSSAGEHALPTPAKKVPNPPLKASRAVSQTESPLRAKAASASAGTSQSSLSAASSTVNSGIYGSGLANLLSKQPLPGLGDDFYNFEQCFSLPVCTEARKDNTWALYRSSTSGLDIIVGSKARTAKADFILLQVPTADLKSSASASKLIQCFAGKLKVQKLSSPAKSVRYLSSGRMEITLYTSQGYKASIFNSPVNADTPKSIVVISRLPQPIEETIKSSAKANPVFKGVFLPADD